MSASSLILSIETTGPVLGLALAAMKNTGPISAKALYFKPSKNKQSDMLFPILTRLKKNVPGRLSLIVVDWGPGSFTGVRVGVAAARAMAQALTIPVVGVSCLDVWAYQTKGAGRVLVQHPALQGEVYYAVFDKNINGSMSVVLPPSWGPVAEAEKKWKALKPTLEADTSSTPHPMDLLAVGAHRYQTALRKSLFTYDRCIPLYLQPSWAQRRRS